MAKTEQEIRGKVGNMVFYKVGNEIRVRSTANDFQDADSEGQHPGRSKGLFEESQFKQAF